MTTNEPSLHLQPLTDHELAAIDGGSPFDLLVEVASYAYAAGQLFGELWKESVANCGNGGCPIPGS